VTSVTAAVRQEHDTLTTRSLVLQGEGDTHGLDRGEDQGSVSGVFGDGSTSALAFLSQLLELRNHVSHQLHDDRSRNIRHNAQGENRHTTQGAATEHVQHAQDAGAVLLENLRHHTRINPWNGDKRADAKNRDRHENKQQARSELGASAES